MKTLTSLLTCVCTLAFLAPLEAEPTSFQASKITFSKKHGWEAVAGKWMTEGQLKLEADSKKADHKQMIFVDYNGAKYRGIYSDKISYGGWWWSIRSSRGGMLDEIAHYAAEGYQPTYVYEHAGFYTAVFVKPEQMTAARQLLDELGIGPATVKDSGKP